MQTRLTKRQRDHFKVNTTATAAVRVLRRIVIMILGRGEMNVYICIFGMKVGVDPNLDKKQPIRTC